MDVDARVPPGVYEAYVTVNVDRLTYDLMLYGAARKGRTMIMGGDLLDLPSLTFPHSRGKFYTGATKEEGMPAAVETMMYAREVPWHRLGTKVDGLQTAAQALDRADLAWDVTKEPLFVAVGDDFVEIPGRYAMTRSSDRKVLGVVSSNYVPLQNKDAFAFADALVDSSEAKYETAGALRDGKWVWMMMEIPKEITIGEGDTVKMYLAIFNSHDGTKAITAMATPVRIVCQNTLEAAISAAKSRWSIRHVQTMEGQLNEARTSLQLSFAYADEFETQMRGLAEQRYTDRQFANLVTKLAAKGEDTVNERMQDGLLDAWVNGTGIEKNKWGAYNAVSEYFEWLRDPKTPHAQMMGTFTGTGRAKRNEALAILSS